MKSPIVPRLRSVFNSATVTPFFKHLCLDGWFHKDHGAKTEWAFFFKVSYFAHTHPPNTHTHTHTHPSSHWPTGPTDFQFDPRSCTESNLMLGFGCHQRKKSSSRQYLQAQSWINSDLLLLSPFCSHHTLHFKFPSSDNLEIKPGHRLCGLLVLRKGPSNLWKVGISLSGMRFSFFPGSNFWEAELKIRFWVFKAFASVLGSVLIFSFHCLITWFEIIRASVCSWRQAIHMQTNFRL